MKIWPNSKANSIGTCSENPSITFPVKLVLEFDTFSQYIGYDHIELDNIIDNSDDKQNENIMSIQENPLIILDQEKEQLDQISKEDHFQKLTTAEKELVWKFKEYCSSQPLLLPKFLTAVDWTNKEKKTEAYYWLQRWAKTEESPFIYLELLTPKFEDQIVRSYAVSNLQSLSDYDINELLYFFLESIKYESNFVSPLAIFLVHRALKNRHIIGEKFYWLSNRLISSGEFAERYSLLLEMYLKAAGDQREFFACQVDFLQKIEAILNCALEENDPHKQTDYLISELKRIKLGPNFLVPFDSSFVFFFFKIQCHN